MKRDSHPPEKIHEVIGLAWADEVSFDAIEKLLGIAEKDVIMIMRSNLKPGSFRIWRERVSGRKTKHRKLLRSDAKKQVQDDDEPDQ
jgi:uncharacterized protein (TIGR03643 family)